MKKILVLTTGGTIEMLPSDDGLTIGSASLAETAEVNTISGAEIVFRHYLSLPSPHITPSIMAELAKELRRMELSKKYDGIVVTHGTDTLEETAFMADIHLEGTLPVVFTAAMRAGNELGVDGPRNIRCAVRVACTETKNLGVTVVLNDEIHAAGRVTKTCTSNVSSFDSPGYGPLGFVDDDKVVYHRLPLWRMRLPSGPLVLDEKVGLVRTAAGFGAEFIDYLTEKKYSGIVVEAFGRGNVYPGTADAIGRAVAAGVLIVITSRSYKGRVLDVYSYPGGGVDLKKRGALFAGDMAGNKVRLFLMGCLGAGMDREQISGLLSGL